MSPIPFNVFSKKQVNKWKVSRAATMMGLTTAAIVLPMEQIPFATDMGIGGKVEAASLTNKPLPSGAVVHYAKTGTSTQILGNPYSSREEEVTMQYSTRFYTVGSDIYVEIEYLLPPTLPDDDDWKNVSRYGMGSDYGAHYGVQFMDGFSLIEQTPISSSGKEGERIVYKSDADTIRNLPGTELTYHTNIVVMYKDPRINRDTNYVRNSNGFAASRIIFPFYTRGPDNIGHSNQEMYFYDKTDLMSYVNSSPVASTIPYQSTSMGKNVSINLPSYFYDPDGDYLTYSASSSNSSIATTSVSGGTLTITPKGLGQSSITVTASDGKGGSKSQTFTFHVQNQPPSITLTNDSPQIVNGTKNIEIKGNVADADGDNITVSAFINGKAVNQVVTGGNGSFTLRWSGNDIAEGTYNNIIVSASDGKGGTRSATFTSTITVDKTAPAQANFSQDITEPTNQDVNVSVSYPADAVTKEFKIGPTGTWQTYAGAIKVTDNNTTIYARGIDLAGNESVASHTVTNIDKIPPEAPTFTQDLTEITPKDVHVTIGYSNDSEVKEYKVEGGEWQTYSAPIRVKRNTTIYARAYDSVGNEIQVSHAVTNIDNMYKVNNDPENLTVEDLFDTDLPNIVAENLEDYKWPFKQYKQDLGQDLTEEDGEKVVEAVNKVLETEKTPSVTSIRAALTVVNTLENGQVKEHFIDRLQALLKAPERFRKGQVTNSSAVLQWDASTLEGVSYLVERDGEKVYEGSELTFIDTGLSPNKEYKYTIKTVVDTLQGAESAYFLTTMANKVGTISFSELLHNSFRATWLANGNPEDTEYRAIVKEGDYLRTDSGWVTSLTGQAINLKPNTDYTVEVIARNALGFETEPVVISVTTSKYITNVVTNLQAVKNDGKQVELTWEHDQEDTEFYVEKYSGSTKLNTIVVQEKSFIDQNVNVNANYTYKVMARSKKYGNLSEVKMVDVKIPYPQAPVAPANLTAESVTKDSFTVKWDASDNAALYYVELLEGSTRKSFQSTKDLSMTFKNLKANTEYTVKVKGMDSFGQYSEISTLKQSTSPLAPPQNLTDFSLLAEGNNVSISWAAVEGARGYYVERYENGVRKLNKFVTSGTSYTDSNLANGTHEYHIIVYHQTGLLAPVKKSITINPESTPVQTKVENLRFAVEGTSVHLSWDALNGTVYGYYVERWQNGQRQLRQLINDNLFVDNSLANGDYEYRVIGYTPDGELDAAITHATISSNSTNSVGPVQNIRSTVQGTNVQLTWDKAAEGIYGYYIERYDQNGVRQYKKLINTNSFNDSSVPSGNFTYKVTVYHKGGETSPSSIDVTVGQTSQVETIQQINAVVEGNQVSLTWDNLDNVYGYFVERWKGSVKESSKLVTSNSYVDSNVSDGNYQYKIIVYSKEGYATPVVKDVIIGSDSQDPTNPTQPTEPKVSDLSANVQSNNVTLNWTGVSGAYGYYVERWKGTIKESSKLVTSAQFTEKNVTDGDYTYKVLVYDKNGTHSPVEESVTIGSGTTPPTPEETAPVTSISDVTSTVEGNKVTLNWNKVDGAYGYYIERWKDGVRAFKKLVTTNSYVDSNVSSGNYTYKVIVYNKDGELPAVEETVNVEGAVTVPTQPEQTPTPTEPEPQPEPTPVSEQVGDITSVVDGKNVTLTWSAINGVYGYFVERWKGNVKEFSKLVTEAEFADANIADGQYEYKVITYSKNGMAAPTSEQVTIGQASSPTPESSAEQPQPAQSAETVTTITPKVEGQTVTLDWNDVNEVYGYYVEKWVNGVKKSSKFVSTSDYVEANVANGTYEYRIVVYSKKTRTFLEPVSVNVTVGS